MLEEPGIVKRGETVDPALVIAAEEYWNPGLDERSSWLLEEVLPSVRRFLAEHSAHRIVFGEDSMYFDSSPEWFLEWIQEGFLATPLPRALFERLRLNSWRGVCGYVKNLKNKPSWWRDQQERDRAERWYKERLVRVNSA